MLYWISLFLIYSFLGWCLEVIYATLISGKFVNRGFLSGPVCPIYGVGNISVIFLLEPLKDNIIILFVGSVILTTVLEFITGFILEKIFHQKWWDYSKEPFNFKGYIALKGSLTWGIACVLVVKVIHPIISGFVEVIPKYFLIVLVVLACISLIVDLLFTILAMLRLKRRISIESKIQELLKKESYLIGENLSDGVLALIKLYEKTFKGKNIVAGRLTRAYEGLGKFREKNKELMDKVKELYNKKNGD